MAVSRINEAGLNVNQYGNRNLIINGGFHIFQRATAATAQTDGAANTADRWHGFVSGGGAYTTQKSTGHAANTGHDTAWKIDVTTADTSIAATDYYSVLQKIEAQNLQQLAYGTSNAKTVTLSFWVRATKTGTSCVFITKNDATQYNYVAEYTISASDTWEYKTITIEPNSDIKAANGAITNDNGLGMQIGWILSYGSNYTAGVNNTWNDSADFATTNQINHMDSTSNDFYITGVQFEVGDTATDFEHRTFGDELQRCQRYFYSLNSADCNGNYLRYLGAFMYDASSADGPFHFPVEMRSVPTLTATGTIGIYDGQNTISGNLSLGTDGSNKQTANVVITSLTGGVAYRPVVVLANANKTSKIDFSAEL